MNCTKVKCHVITHFRLSLAVLAVFAVPLVIQAQVDTAWVRRYDGGGLLNWDAAYAIAVDRAGNVCVTGYSFDPGGTNGDDYVTIKYRPNGDVAWMSRYNGPANDYDEAKAIAVDTAGNVYVTGGAHGSLRDYDYATIKYRPNGDTAWVRCYNGPGDTDDVAHALAVDGAGNVYVTGYSYRSSSSRDYATIKYWPDGDTAWVRRYSGISANALAVDDAGNVYVTGEGYGSGTPEDYLTIKYNPNGDTDWVRRYNGPGNSVDQAAALAVDRAGNVLVTGNSADDFATVKYNANGDTVWVRRYNGPGNGVDWACALAVDSAGDVYVAGPSTGSGTYCDCTTIKYGAGGDTVWVRRYNGPGNSTDEATSLAVDDSDNVYVAGGSIGSGSSYDYVTIKYDANGVECWVARYNGTGNDYDEVHAIAVDTAGNVYVTGESMADLYTDYVTIKYLQTTVGLGEQVVRDKRTAQPTLLECRPDPFRLRTVIRYSTRVESGVSLSIYDAAGQLARTLLRGQAKPGTCVASWDGTDDHAKLLPDGVYFVTLHASTQRETRKLTLSRR